MKQFFTIVLLCTIINSVYSQSILPLSTDEYCPNTEYTFTASIPNTYSSMAGINGSYITQLPTIPVGSSFTFKGKFGDANQKQSFRVYYTDNTFYDFEFKKIKSLYFSDISSALFRGTRNNHWNLDFKTDLFYVFDGI